MHNILGACPRIENLLRESWIWPDFPIIFVKYAQYSPQIIEKSKSNQLSLATAPILGQAPSLFRFTELGHHTYWMLGR